MAVTAKLFGPGLQSLLNGEIDWDTDVIKAMITTSAYVPNQDTHRYKSSVTNEVSGTGYTAGGATLASKTATYDAPTNTLVLDCADIVFTTSTITGRNVVFYVSTGSDATSALIGYWDNGTDFVTTAADLTLTIAAGGLFTYTAA